MDAGLIHVPEGRRIFAELTLNDSELGLYDQVFHALSTKVPVPDLVVYLHAPLRVILSRIQRRGRSFEQNIDPDYLERLCDAGYAVSLETSGALDIGGVDPRVSRVLDIKTPGSGEVARNLWSNLPLLTAHDQVKFVICSREDFDWATAVLAEHRLHERCDVLFSPSHGQVGARELADWIVADRLPVRFQVQLHKLLWNDEPGR